MIDRIKWSCHDANKRKNGIDRMGGDPMLRKTNHSVPWILLLVVLIQFVRGLAMPYGVLILYLLSIYALFDIYQSRGDGDTLLYWSLFGCAVGGIFLWWCCAQREWLLAVIPGCGICGLLGLMWRIWKQASKNQGSPT